MLDHSRDPFLLPKPLLTSEQQQVLSGWILDYLSPYNVIIDNDLPAIKTSLELGRAFLARHRLKLIKCTPTVGQFEYAMHLCGFKPIQPVDPTTMEFESYELSPKSLLFIEGKVKAKWK